MLFSLSRTVVLFCFILTGILLFSRLQSPLIRYGAVQSAEYPGNCPNLPCPADLAGAYAAGNSTLGFEKILALSHAPTWRTRGLLKAAEYCGIDIDIPKQAQWSSEFVDAFRSLGSINVPHPKQGAALAWLAHLDLVKHFIMSDYDTALILEDDVDWDVNIKEQAVRIAEAVRTYSNVTETEQAPYGRWWDILWLGLCAEFVDTNKSYLAFSDPTVIPKSKYNGWTKEEHVLQIPEGERFVQQALGPICTFGYAISRPGAAKILQHVGHGQHEAYDLQLSFGCRAGFFKCISINPEVFHQYYPPLKSGYVSMVEAGNGKDGVIDHKNFEDVMGSTENIVASARCHAIFGKPCAFSEDDLAMKIRSSSTLDHKPGG